MKATRLVRVVFATLTLAGAAAAYADENGENVLYIGAGSAKSGDPLGSSETPMSFAYLKISNASDLVWGFDIGREGTTLDSTGGHVSTAKRSTSFNLLVG